VPGSASKRHDWSRIGHAGGAQNRRGVPRDRRPRDHPRARRPCAAGHGSGPRPTGPLRPSGSGVCDSGPRNDATRGASPVSVLRKVTSCDSRVPPSPGGLQYPGQRQHRDAPTLTDIAHAGEVESLANERFAAVGGTVLAAPAESGLSARRVANVISWFVVAQLALGPWRSRGEVRPAGLAGTMGVSRWTEWRARRDAVRAGVVRAWSLPDPEARGYGRGAVRVVELAFVRTRAVTQKVAAQREERATRAERRRGERARVKAERAVHATAARTDVSPVNPSGAEHRVTRAVEPVTFAELTSPAAARLWPLIERIQARHSIERQGAPQAHPPPG
jgi:hypothetical protein